ncbi:MAG: hypothetical protein EXQ70_11570 [Solirubrobacterales bacterium]|nr:hypothetical protein [Solirubrobacterales bacterium]
MIRSDRTPITTKPPNPNLKSLLPRSSLPSVISRFTFRLGIRREAVASPRLHSLTSHGGSARAHRTRPSPMGRGLPWRCAQRAWRWGGRSDTIGELLPSLPASWGDVTLAQAMQHTSGLPSFTANTDFLTYLGDHLRDYMSPLFAISFVFGEDLVFTPGRPLPLPLQDGLRPRPRPHRQLPRLHAVHRCEPRRPALSDPFADRRLQPAATRRAASP